MRRFLTPVLAALAMLAVVVPMAAATPRKASPFSNDTTGQCDITACRLDRAVAVAQAGEEVLLESGTYTVNYPVQVTKAITIRPLTSNTKPVLQGSSGSPTLDLTAGGTVSGLRIETSADIGLQLAGGAKGVGLEVMTGASAAASVKMLSAPAGTALVNSVARTTGAGTAVDVIDGATPGGVSLVNVTAVATGGNSWGVTTYLTVSNPVLKNSYVRATSKDLHGRSGSLAIATSSSNFRPATAANFTAGAGNQQAAVTFADEAGGDLRPVVGAPTIDAGATDALTTGTVDPDGRARSLGTAPDIGAYEYGAPPTATGTGTGTVISGGDTTSGTTSGTMTTQSPTTTPDGALPADTQTTTPGELPPAAPPVAAETVTVEAAKGTPLVRLPGASTFLPLEDASAIPVGSTVDVTSSRIKLTSVRDTAGRTQTGEFWGGRFVVRQPKAKLLYTDLVLTGSSFAGCPTTARRATARAAAATAKRRKPRAVVRSLWGRDSHGRFRTRGRNSVATVRGTVWLVADRRDGTLTRVRP